MTKLFSPEEANALIPTVRPIVTAVTRHYRTVTGFQNESRRAAEAGREYGGGGLVPSSSASGQRFCQALLSLAEKTSALEALGVQLKDYGRGLIDFPSLREGRVVLLCWLLGEGDRVEWWHETDAGFAGRQPLT